MTADDIGVPTRAWVDVVRRARLGKTVKAVAVMLSTYADPDGTRVFPGVARLAVDCELSWNSIKTALAELRRVQLIELVRTVPRHEYRLTFGAALLDRCEILSPADVADVAERIAAAHRHPSRAGTRQPTAWAVDTGVLSDTTRDSQPTTRAVSRSEDSPPDGLYEGMRQPTGWAEDTTGTAHGMGHETGGTAHGTRHAQPTAWSSTYQDQPHTYPPSDDTIPVRTSRLAPARDPAPMPDRCRHGFRARLRPDGTSTCALCRRVNARTGQPTIAAERTP